jgi:hypothetical protein
VKVGVDVADGFNDAVIVGVGVSVKVKVRVVVEVGV